MMRKTLGVLLPVIFNVGIFFILYNNTQHGMMTLAAVILLNLLALFCPVGLSSRLVDPTLLRITCLYLVFVVGSWMASEALFPRFSPSEYARLQELTKHIRNSGNGETPSDAVLFDNEDQRIRLKELSEKPDRKNRVSWHRPGEPFEYHGYDPNSDTAYRNRFYWNSRGYFDHDHEMDKPAHTNRVLVVGDSYVESIQVPLRLTFHKRMEASLNKLPLGESEGAMEVIALGNSGTGQAAHLKVIKTEAMAFKPDLLVLTLCSNDFCDDDPQLKSKMVLFSGEFGSVTRGLLRHGFLALTFAVRQYQILQRNRIVVSPELTQWAVQEVPGVEEAWKRTLDYVRESSLFCEREGISFLLVYLGSEIEVKYALDPEDTVNSLRDMGKAHKEIHWDMGKSIRRVSEYCARNNIAFLSLLRPLAQAQAETGKAVFADHYSMFGHEIVSRVLTCVIQRYLETKALLNFDGCLDIKVIP
jgi:hypothetical protein